MKSISCIRTQTQVSTEHSLFIQQVKLHDFDLAELVRRLDVSPELAQAEIRQLNIPSVWFFGKRLFRCSDIAGLFVESEKSKELKDGIEGQN